MGNLKKDIGGRIMQDKHGRTPKKSERHRKIYVNDAQRNAGFFYINNKIRTSKYNLLTFLPRNLFEQFQRVANFYFLCFLILLIIPYLSPFMPIIFILPLGTVLAFTAVKDAYDDIERHRNDRRVNSRIALVLRNGVLIEEKWESIVVGDIIRLENDHFVTADILLLSTSEPHGLCYIETSELDGETNLKCRQCLSETAALGNDHQAIGAVKATITCEAPNEILNRFEGVLKWCSDDRVAARNDNGDDIGDASVDDSGMQSAVRFLPLTNDQLLLRGCVLRNTQWCYGVVIFAGKDTKLMQNSGKTKHKRTTVDYLLNYIIVGIAMFLISLCVVCSLSRNLWEMEYINFRRFMPWMQVTEDWKVEPRSVGVATPIGVGQDIIKSLDEVIELTKKNPRFDKLFGRHHNNSSNSTTAFSPNDVVVEPIAAVVAGVLPHVSSHSSASQIIAPSTTATLASPVTAVTAAAYGNDYMTIATISFFAFFSYAILMSGLVPISLYVSIEIVRLIHSWWINWDNQMCYNGERARARSTMLSDELGQIEYIFSDKTGTLTQNVMTFKGCSIAGRMFGLLCDAYGNYREPCANDRRVNFAERNRMADTGFTFYDHSLWQLILDSKCADSVNNNNNNNGMDLTCSRTTSPLGLSPTPLPCDNNNNNNDDDLTNNRNLLPDVITTAAYADDVSQLLCSSNASSLLVQSLLQTQQQTGADVISCDPTDMFFRLLSICHTVMPGEKNGQLIYQAQSPDEGALVRAARNFGYVFCQRTPHSITVQQTLGDENELVFNLLAILDFNNVRRRMSVIVRDPLMQNRIVIYTKGADSVVFERLADTEHNRRVRISTDEHLDRFAGEGLRTLVLAYRVIDEAEFEAWQTNYLRPASLAVADDRDEKLDEAYDKIEQNLTLLGATAIEDKLQDGVADTIANILQAGIYVWVLTGDKMETAINIGYSCKLLTDHLETVFVIDATNDAAELQDQLLQAKYCIDQSSQQDHHRRRPSSDYEEEYDDVDGKSYTKKVGFAASSGVGCAPGDYCFSASTTKTAIPRAHTVMVDCIDAADQKVPLNRQSFSDCAGGDQNNNSFSVCTERHYCMAQVVPQIKVAVMHDAVLDQHQQCRYAAPPFVLTTNSSLLNTSDATVCMPASSVNFGFGSSSSIGDVRGHLVSNMHENPLHRIIDNSAGDAVAISSSGGGGMPAMNRPASPLPSKANVCANESPPPAIPSANSGGFALVVNGSSLCQAMELGLIDLFLDVALKCKTVIVCRATPLQKALVVKLIRQRCQAVTLAVGDGANDVSMIKEAHVGVGISGQEGMQAVMASDFSIAQFRFLQRLLLVHGRWSYYRMSKFLRYFFYKNFACYLTHFFYAWYSGFTTLSVYDPWFLTFYNMFYTALPVLAMAAFDQDVDEANSSKFPQLYALGLRMRFFNYKTFFVWAGGGSLTSFLLFYVVMLNFDDLHLLAPYHSFALALATILVLVVTVQICLDTEYWTWINVVTVVVSLASFFIFSALQSGTTSPPKWQSQFLGVFSLLAFRCEFWLTALLCIVLFSGPVIAARCIDTELHPTLAGQIKWRQLAHVGMRSSRSLQLQAERDWRRRRGQLRHESTRKRQQPAVRSSYAFSHEAGFARLITEGVNMRGSHSGLAVSSTSRLNSGANKQHVIKRIAKWPATAAAGLLSNLTQPLGNSLTTMMKKSTSDAGPLGDVASAAGASRKSADAVNADENVADVGVSEIAAAAELSEVAVDTARNDVTEGFVIGSRESVVSASVSSCTTTPQKSVFAVKQHQRQAASSTVSLDDAPNSSLLTQIQTMQHPAASRMSSPDYQPRSDDAEEQHSAGRLRSTSVDRLPNIRNNFHPHHISSPLRTTVIADVCIDKSDDSSSAAETIQLAHAADALWLSSSAKEMGSPSGVAREELRPTTATPARSSTLPNRLQSPAETSENALLKKKNVRFQPPPAAAQHNVLLQQQYRSSVAAAQRPITLGMQTAASGAGAQPSGGSSLASRHSNILHLQQLAAAKKRQQLLLEQQQQQNKAVSDVAAAGDVSSSSSSPALPSKMPISGGGGGDQSTEFISTTVVTRIPSSSKINNSKLQNVVPSLAMNLDVFGQSSSENNFVGPSSRRAVTPSAVESSQVSASEGECVAEAVCREATPPSFDRKNEKAQNSRSTVENAAAVAGSKMSPISAALWKLAGFAPNGSGSANNNKSAETSGSISCPSTVVATPKTAAETASEHLNSVEPSVTDGNANHKID